MSNTYVAEYNIFEAVAEHDHFGLLWCIEEAVISAARATVLHNGDVSLSVKRGVGESKMDEAHHTELQVSSSHSIGSYRKKDVHIANVDDDCLLPQRFRYNEMTYSNGTHDQAFVDACSVLTETEMRRVASHLVNASPPVDFKVRPPRTISTSDEYISSRCNRELGPVFDTNGSLLHLACICDNQIALAVLLIFGADIRSRHTNFRRLAIHEAACWDSSSSLRLLLHISCLDSNCQVSNTEEFHFNCRQNFFLDMVLYLRDLCSPINACDPNYNGKSCDIAIEVIEILQNELPLDTILQLKDAPLQMDGYGNTSIHWSAFKNSIRCLEILLDEKHQTPTALYANVRSTQSGWTPLHDAAYSNSHECIELLLKAGANVNACAKSGATPLCFAAQEDAEQATQLLLENGANAELRCSGNAHGILPNAIGFNAHRFSGYTPLHYCAHYNASLSAKILLRQNNKDVLMSLLDFSKETPIHVAALRGSSDVLRELLAAGALLTNENPSSVSYSLQRQDILNESMWSSSPILRAMLPRFPVLSSKPWNCLAQQNIDECMELLDFAESCWSPRSHRVFTPSDRTSAVTLLRVGKRLEQERGMFIEFAPLVLTFCGRGWFEKSDIIDRSSACGLNTQHFPSPIYY